MHEESPDPQWRRLGEFAPWARAEAREAERDLGPGGSLVQHARRRRAVRVATRPTWHSRTVIAGAGVASVAALVAAIAGAVAAAVVLAVVALCARAGVLWLRWGFDRVEKKLVADAAKERRTAAALQHITGYGWQLLHDRLMPASEHRLAHIAVGPAGIAVLSEVSDSEHGLTLAGTNLYAGGAELTPWLAARCWEAETLDAAMREGLMDEPWQGPVIPIAVLLHSGSSGPPPAPPEWGSVAIRTRQSAASLMTGLPAPLSRTHVASLAGNLEEMCRPAGRADT